MAARWGAGEENLTACSLDLFATNALDETVGLNSEDNLEALQGCIDPSILSIFEDTPTGEAKGLDLESEATLLTALTEILDNVDDENLSPFDTLPDSDLLSGQKGREHSPLRRLLCLSRSPPEKDSTCNTRSFSNGKSLPRIQAGSVQRSDGEEEEDGSLTMSPVRQLSLLDKDLPDWGGLTLPLPFAFEEEVADEDGISISLGDLVKQMHPYCVAVCVEDAESEQMLPEGGIFLEVVDQGEDGEAILAIPDLDLPLSLPLMQDTTGNEQMVPDESQEEAAGSSEDIIVDDEEDLIVSDSPVKAACTLTPVLSSHLKGEKVSKRPNGSKTRETRQKSPPCRTRKGREGYPSPPVERRVLRSTSTRKAVQELPPNPKAVNQKKKKAALVSPTSTLVPSSPKHKKLIACKPKAHPEVTTLTLPSQKKGTAQTTSNTDPLPGNASAARSQLNCVHVAVNSLQHNETPKQLSPTPEKQEVLSTAASVVPPPPQVALLSSDRCLAGGTPQTAEPLDVALPPVVPETTEVAPPEPKPKALSLAEYRRLRQQKKPTPVVKPVQQSTKWPSLPELPKELPPIPCLPDPSPRDTRRPNSMSGKKEVVEVKTAWQPMGPGAPPTPEALLVPPAYMVATSHRVGNASTLSKTQQTSVPQPDAASMPSQPQPSSAAPSPVKNIQPSLNGNLLPAKPCVSPGSVSQLTPPSEKERSTAPSREKSGVLERPHYQPITPTCVVANEVPSKTTTETQKLTTAIVSAQIPSSVLQKTTAIVSAQIPSSVPQKTTAIVSAQILSSVPQKTTAIVSAQIPSSVPQKTTAIAQNVPQSVAATSVNDPTSAGRLSKIAVLGEQLSFPRTACSSKPSQNKMPAAVLHGAQGKLAKAPEAPWAKSQTQEIIEAFTREIGIEAADMTSLLEQFEENQAKEEHCVPEVSGRAAAVGNSSVALPLEKTTVERVRANDICCTAALTPPATPPHQLWKPLAPMALLGKSKTLEDSKPALSKVIQIEARPLPSGRCRSKPTAAAAMVSPQMVLMDHDYCLTNPEVSTGEPGKRWNVKQQPSITIKTVKQLEATTTRPRQSDPVSTTQTPNAAALPKMQASLLNDRAVGSSVLETPDASPTRPENEAPTQGNSPGRHPSARSYRRHTPSRSPSPTSGPRDGKRGRSRKRGAYRSPSPTSCGSQSSSESRSRSPPKKKYCRSRSGSSSASSSPSSSRSVSRSPQRRRRYSYSSSRSGSWSRSRSRSPQRCNQWRRERIYSPSYRPGYRNSSRETPDEAKRRKEKAIEERRVVYVGRIRGTMTRRELRERFSFYGEIEDCTLHFRDHGDNYGFVTYYDTKDAFTAIENGSKLRKPDELPFDLCFGGRRQFCQSSYSDLDCNREYGSAAAKDKFHALDFDTLLKQAQKNQKR